MPRSIYEHNAQRLFTGSSLATGGNSFTFGMGVLMCLFLESEISGRQGYLGFDILCSKNFTFSLKIFGEQHIFWVFESVCLNI